MVNEDELTDMIVNIDLEKVDGPKDIWEKKIDLDDGRSLVVGYEEESKVCQGLTKDLTSGTDEEKCAITYSWYWEVRDSETWDVIYENHDTDLGFCSEDLQKAWSDESTFENVGDVPGTELCTWSDQNGIDDIVEDIIDDIRDVVKIQ
ncbi:hypothetical protein [Methanobacterium sp. MBAC-LM]|uniref:hypothetical protein n=1 Tax=Methanobacterium sp. MBAC-LM TaxID=3412034 RepID=UPI003C747CCB